MKIWIAVTMAAALAVAVLLYFHLRSHSTSSQPVAHVENSFEFTVHAPYERVAPLFGALAERAWGGDHWQPEFLYPLPARDEPGEVFTVRHGHQRAVWVNTALDLRSGNFQYVYFIPQTQVALIDVHVQARGTAETGVKVSYQRTALNPGLNSHITDIGRRDAQSGPEWASAIEACLKGR